MIVCNFECIYLIIIIYFEFFDGSSAFASKARVRSQCFPLETPITANWDSFHTSHVEYVI